MTHRHDQSDKLLLSEPRVMRDLLTDFVEGEWVEQLDRQQDVIDTIGLLVQWL